MARAGSYEPPAAAKKIIQNGFTRAGVFQGEKFPGWVTLSDPAKGFSKQGLLDALIAHDEAKEKELRYLNCPVTILEKITTGEGR